MRVCYACFLVRVIVAWNALNVRAFVLTVWLSSPGVCYAVLPVLRHVARHAFD